MTSFWRKVWGGTAVARERRAAGGMYRFSVSLSVIMGTASESFYFGRFEPKSHLKVRLSLICGDPG
jgi:hypothetical protein